MVGETVEGDARERKGKDRWETGKERPRERKEKRKGEKMRGKE